MCPNAATETDARAEIRPQALPLCQDPLLESSLQFTSWGYALHVAALRQPKAHTSQQNLWKDFTLAQHPSIQEQGTDMKPIHSPETPP